MASVSNRLAVTTQRRRMVGWLLVSALLFIRIPYEGVIRYFEWPADPVWVIETYAVATYALIALLVYWERDRLAQFHFTRLALILFALGPLLEGHINWFLGRPLWLSWQWAFHGSQIVAVGILIVLFAHRERHARFQWLVLAIALGLVVWGMAHDLRAHWLLGVDLTWQNTNRFAQVVIGLVLFVALLLSRQRAPDLGEDRVYWLGIAAATGLVAAMIGGYLVVLFQSGQSGSIPAQPFIAVELFVTQLTRAAIYEEPLFRGFLWGYLRESGLPEVWVWLIQAALFWVAHMYYFGRLAISFWVVVPLGGLLFGWLAWRSRSIASSMIAHGLFNGIAQLIIFYRI